MQADTAFTVIANETSKTLLKLNECLFTKIYTKFTVQMKTENVFLYSVWTIQARTSSIISAILRLNIG